MPKRNVMRYFALFVTLLLIISTLVFWRTENTEFMYYNILFFCLLVVFVLSDKRLKFTVPVLVSMTLLLIMHTLGGIVHIGGTRLYDIPLGMLQYDNVLHFMMGMIFAFLTLNLFHELHHWQRKHRTAFFFIIVITTLGFGALVEVAEYLGVAFLNAPGVGGYINNAKDLVFDTLGGIAGAITMLGIENGK